MAQEINSRSPISVPSSLLTPIKIPQRLLFGPGPSNAPPRVLAASALPLVGHMHKEFLNVMDEIMEGLRYLFQTDNKLTIAISGTGHAAMEAAIANIIERNDKVLVGVNGIWGARVSDLSTRYGIFFIRNRQHDPVIIISLKVIVLDLTSFDGDRIEISLMNQIFIRSTVLYR